EAAVQRSFAVGRLASGRRDAARRRSRGSPPPASTYRAAGRSGSRGDGLRHAAEGFLQVAAGLLAAAAGGSADPAVLMHLRMFGAFVAAAAAGLRTGFQQPAERPLATARATDPDGPG